MNAFILSRATRIVADETLPPIRHAAQILRRDMREILTEEKEANVIRVILDGRVGAERFRAAVCDDEITLICGDDLGAVYGLLSISEQFLGVKPLAWWMGLPVEKRPFIELPEQLWRSPEYAVRWRCWFANDEVLFTGWHIDEPRRAEVWRRLFETILRCGGNMVIPGTDREYDGDRLNEMALDMGLWITQHHTELLGAKMFAREYPELDPSYARHPDEFEKLWRDAVRRFQGRRVLWTIGYRGQGDCAFWHSEGGFDTDAARAGYISRVMRRQMDLVREFDPKAVFSTNLYGEMMGFYRAGLLDIPEGVVKIWGDNGFGRMVSRRQNNLNPRVDAMPGAGDPGPHGIYYHVSFYDLQAANHITMLQNPPQMIADELRRVLERGAEALWNINVGSVKPHVFMLELVRRMWRDGACDAEQLARDFARDYFGSEAAAPLYTQYAQSAIPYGPNADDRAGDQYYHFPLRALAHALLRGETDGPVESLLWATGEVSFREQAMRLARLAEPGMASWKQFVRNCRSVEDDLPEDAAARLRDSLTVQGMIHRAGCEGLFAFGQACVHALDGDDFQAYLWTDKALESARGALAAMRRVRGRFAHIYDNDCFAGVGLTAQVLEGVRAWLRIRGDGALLFNWEKEFLVPESDRRISLQSHRSMQLSDDELCLRLRGLVRPERAF